MNKVFLENLPRKYGIGANKNKLIIDWYNSIGMIVKFIYGNIEGHVEIVNYDGKYLYIKYNEKEPFKIKTDNFQGCRLGKLLGKITNEFKFDIGISLKDDKRDITIINREYRNNPYNKGKKLKYYKYTCNKCGWTKGYIEESNLLKGVGCPVCCNPPVTVVHGINDITTTDSWMIKYFQGGYDEAKKFTKSSNQKIFPICPDCGRIKDKKIKISDIYKTKSISCSCGDGYSMPNKTMFNILEQLSIYFTPEYSPEWIGRKLYDFYIPSKNIIIEMDGRLGHGKEIHGKSKKSKEETKADDDYKDLMAEQHGIKVIRINCDKSNLEYIKDNILKSELMEYFNFSNINWLKVEEFALKNRVKEVCEYKNNNPNMTTTEIGKIMKLNKSTIANYLKRGSKLGWCEYSPKEENRKSGIKSGKACSKPIEIFKDGVSLGIFESINELERQSEVLFDTKLFSSAMSKVCLKKQEYHKGFTFEYVDSYGGEYHRTM